MSVLRFAFIFMISLFIAQSVMADEQEVYNGVVAHPKDDPGQYLKEILAHTYQFNPTIQAERNRLKSVDEEYAIAISGFRPTIIADGSHAINNTESKGPTITTGRKTLNQQTIGATISQPIFNGWKTISSVKSANKNIMAARESLRLVEQNVLLEAISAYYDVVKDQKILAVNENNVKVLEEQQKATQARFKVGQLTKTDVSQAESRLARGLSEKIRAEGRLKISRANFQRIIGFDQPRTLEFSKLDVLAPHSLDDAISFALDNAPTYLQSKYNEEAAHANIGVVRGDLWPEISVDGSAVRNFDPATTVKRSDSAKVMANLTVPLYQAGSVSARVRQSKQIAKQREEQVEESRRQVVDQTTQSWADLQTAVSTINASQKEVNSTKVALEGVRAESRVGKRTILDILDAEQEYLDAQTRLITARRDEVITNYALLNEIGQLDEIVSLLPTEAYDPMINTKRTKYRFVGTSVK